MAWHGWHGRIVADFDAQGGSIHAYRSQKGGRPGFPGLPISGAPMRSSHAARQKMREKRLGPESFGPVIKGTGLLLRGLLLGLLLAGLLRCLLCFLLCHDAISSVLFRLTERCCALRSAARLTDHSNSVSDTPAAVLERVVCSTLQSPRTLRRVRSRRRRAHAHLPSIHTYSPCARSLVKSGQRLWRSSNAPFDSRRASPRSTNAPSTHPHHTSSPPTDDRTAHPASRRPSRR